MEIIIIIYNEISIYLLWTLFIKIYNFVTMLFLSYSMIEDLTYTHVRTHLCKYRSNLPL